MTVEFLVDVLNFEAVNLAVSEKEDDGAAELVLSFLVGDATC